MSHKPLELSQEYVFEQFYSFDVYSSIDRAIVKLKNVDTPKKEKISNENEVKYNRWKRLYKEFYLEFMEVVNSGTSHNEAEKIMRDRFNDREEVLQELLLKIANMRLISSFSRFCGVKNSQNISNMIRHNRNFSAMYADNQQWFIAKTMDFLATI